MSDDGRSKKRQKKSKLEREKMTQQQSFRHATKVENKKKRGLRPSAPRNTGQDLVNQQPRVPTPSPNDGNMSPLSRVFSMSNFANSYGSNVAFQGRNCDCV
jgi:hypothetical protein